MADLFSSILQRAALGLLFFVIAGCSQKPELVKLSGDTMGTRYNISLMAPGDFEAEAAQQQLDALLQAFNQIASTYEPKSEVNALSAMTLEDWHDISHTLSDMLLISLEVNWLTGGAFDVTISPLVELWGFGAERRRQHVPSQSAIDAALEETGFRHLQLDLTEPRIKIKQPVTVDLSGVAKGYGVDMVAQWLERQGVANYLVEIGGEIRAAGQSARGDVWRVGIEKPQGLAAGVQQAIRVSGVGLATSGDYRNYFEDNGTRYSHTLDPKTGYPIKHRTASVTVIAENAAYADALATGLLVLGGDKALKLAETHNLAIFVIEKTDSGFETRWSKAFEPYLD
ncbi:FAD:protein FMN transferase [Litorivivens sp.]|uniref:FAD:protein FMN transferase n=2 Tax=Litorivivens sp. TaxID=2020868 RepID=UPI003562A57D